MLPLSCEKRGRSDTVNGQWSSLRQGYGRQAMVNGQQRPGSLLVDALLAITIFGLVVAAFSSGIGGGREGTVRGGSRARAIYLAEEGIQAVRTIRDKANGWALIKGLTGNKGVQLSGTDWAIANAPTTADGIFTRTITIGPATPPNVRARKVTATVGWTENPGNQPRSVSLDTQLTDWHTNPPPLWSNPDLVGSVTNPALNDAWLEDVVVKTYSSTSAFAFVADSGAGNEIIPTSPFGLVIFDVSTLTAPTYVGPIDGPDADALMNDGLDVQGYDVEIYGNYVYLATADPSGELKIIDVSSPASVRCDPCAGSINIDGSGTARSLFVAGSKLYVGREAANPSSAEVVVYDLASNPTSPTLVTSYDSDPDGARSVNGLSTVTDGSTNYAYAATTWNTGELSVIRTTGGTALTGGGGSPDPGKTIAVFGDGAFLGTSGANACEVFSFNISTAALKANPNIDHSCGTNQTYDLGGSADSSASDAAISQAHGYLFIAGNTKVSGVNRFLHIIDANDPTNISHPSHTVYNGDPPASLNVTAGRNVEFGLFYREDDPLIPGNDHTLFMVGGDEWSPSDLVIIQP